MKKNDKNVLAYELGNGSWLGRMLINVYTARCPEILTCFLKSLVFLLT